MLGKNSGHRVFGKRLAFLGDEQHAICVTVEANPQIKPLLSSDLNGLRAGTGANFTGTVRDGLAPAMDDRKPAFQPR